eukprot:TRINITY_DN6825_c0_g1_i1.p2 TRINITY_DN6825_c0_g1~~TRINITY_DN6825_c0_g1_i1.p2  ORF type:complete len:202 (+),score=40.49 TRINITY_DN6825_c0_g1_i1:7-612(+)
MEVTLVELCLRTLTFCLGDVPRLERIQYLPHDLRTEILQRCVNYKTIKDDHIMRMVNEFTSELDLSGTGTINNTSITDKSIIHIADFAKNIKHIVLERVYAISEASLIYLSSNLNALEWLDISRSKKVTDKLIHNIIDNHASTLKGLLANRCGNITNDSISRVMKECTKLEHLDLMGCVKIDDNSFETKLFIIKNSNSFKM